MANVEKMKNYFLGKKPEIFLTVLVAIIGVYFSWNIINILIFTFFIWVVLNPISSRLLAFPALFLLAISPFFLIFGQKIIAEQTANFAYYFLVLSVIMGIYEMQDGKTEE